MEKSIDWWNIIIKITRDNSTWDYLEPAEIIELIQRIAEAKEKIKDFDKHIIIQLSPALNRLGILMSPWSNYTIYNNLKLYKNQFSVA